jgi:hypothetical protein
MKLGHLDWFDMRCWGLWIGMSLDHWDLWIGIEFWIGMSLDNKTIDLAWA